MSTPPLFRVSFLCKDSVYDIYARQVCESEMVGFIEVEEFVFGKTSTVVVDPSEERLKNEFSDVKRSYIPMHTIIRIDEVSKEGVAKITDNGTGNISHFPTKAFSSKKDETKNT